MISTKTTATTTATNTYNKKSTVGSKIGNNEYKLGVLIIGHILLSFRTKVLELCMKGFFSTFEKNVHCLLHISDQNYEFYLQGKPV